MHPLIVIALASLAIACCVDSHQTEVTDAHSTVCRFNDRVCFELSDTTSAWSAAAMLVTSTPAGIVVDIDGAQLVNVEEVTAADVLSVIDADSVLLSSTEIKDLIRRAKGSIAKRRIREALDILAPMLIEDFNNPEAYEAMLQLLRAVATQHPSPRNFRTLGNHLLKHKRLDEARNALAQAVELLGTNGSALAACEKGTMQVLLAISMPTFFESEVKLQEELASLLRRISLLSRSSELLFETAPAMSYTSFLKGGGRETWPFMAYPFASTLPHCRKCSSRRPQGCTTFRHLQHSHGSPPPGSESASFPSTCITIQTAGCGVES